MKGWKRCRECQLQCFRIIIIMSILPKGRSFTANSGTKAAVLLKGRSSTANSGTRASVLLGMDRCGSFPLLSTPHSLFSIWTYLKRWEDPRGTNVEVRRVDLANWVLQTSQKFTTGVKYRFHQGFWPDQRSRNPNQPSPPCFRIFHVKMLGFKENNHSTLKTLHWPWLPKWTPQ